MRSRFLLMLACLTAGVCPAKAQLQSPETFLGYRLGDAFTPHHRMVDYVEHVASQASHVQLIPYGETYEDRPLMVAIVSSPENMNRLEELRTNNLKLTGLMEGEPGESTVGIVWLSYNVHGNESVSTEAAIQTLYDLADPNNARTRTWLENTIVIIDPCINPDGRERYVQWYKRTRGAYINARPDAREHHEPWPGGRTNHYLFDLNRDWAWLTQQETQGRIALYRQWMPHVHVDFHEQGVDAPYYFAPAAQPYHESITAWQREFQTTIGKNHTRYFDQNNWLYFTRQVFDLLYPSYGDTWPTFNGAVGMTYEQGGSGRAGLAVVTATGDTLTLADRIAHHHTTGLSTIEVTAQNSERVITEFKKYFDEATQNPQGPYKTFVVKSTNPADKLDTLRSYLDAQNIRYGYAPEDRSLRGFVYKTGTLSQVNVTRNDLLISVYQPMSVLTRVLFEPSAQLTDSLTYDITAWALPYAFGIEAYALEEKIDPVAHPAVQAAQLTILESPYAYLAEWKSLADLRLLTTLLRNKIKVRFAEKPFTIQNRRYDPGTLIITRTDNESLGDRFDILIKQATESAGQVVFPVPTGLVTDGADFGSSDVNFLKPPRVALLGGKTISSSGLGEIWHYFDQQINYPVTVLDTDYWEQVKLYEYDVLILPGGTYTSVFNEEELTKLRNWIRAGGRLIAVDRAAGFLADKSGFNLKQKPPDSSATQSAQATSQKKYGDRTREAVSGSTPGSIYAVELDNTHPLGFGYSDTYFTLKLRSTAYEYLRTGWNVGVLQASGYRSGFVGTKVKERLDKTLVFGVQTMGQGEVVYMIDNPLFRAFWYNGKLLFGNAVFLVGQ